MHHLRLLYLISRSAFAMLLPVWILVDLRAFGNDEKLAATHKNPLFTFILLLLSGCIMFAQNIVAFTVISLLTPLSYKLRENNVLHTFDFSISSFFSHLFVACRCERCEADIRDNIQSGDAEEPCDNGEHVRNGCVGVWRVGVQ